MIIHVAPSAGGAGIKSALDAVTTAGGGTVLLDGVYDITTQLTSATTMNNVKLKGSPGTVLLVDPAIEAYAVKLNNVNTAKNVNNTTRGNTSITTTTASDAAFFLAGDYVIIYGTDAEGFDDVDYNVVSVNGVVGTGVVELKWPLAKTLTSNSARSIRYGRNNIIENLTIRLDGVPSVFGAALDLNGQINCDIYNVSIEGFDQSPNYGNPIIEMANCINVNFQDSRIEGCQNDGIRFDFAINCKAINSKFNRNSLAAVTNQGALNFDYSYDCQAVGCEIIASGSNGINGRVGGRRNKAIETSIKRPAQCGVRAVTSKELTIDLCTISDAYADSSSSAILLQANTHRANISRNTITGCKYGVYIDGGLGQSVSENRIHDCSSYGIVLAPGATVSGVGNRISRCVDAGILISASSNNNFSGGLIDTITGKGVLISGDSNKNSITGMTIVSTTGNAIELEAATDDNLVALNMAKSLSIVNNGTNNTLSNNIT
jgi:hypothetical protein